jgi:transporter family protein
MVHQLVRGAADGDTESGLAGAASLHEFEFRVTTEVWIGQGRISIPERNRRVAYLRGLKPPFILSLCYQGQIPGLPPGRVFPQPVEPRTIFSMNWIGWALLSAGFAAATALLAKVGVAHVDSNLATALRTSVVVVFAWGIALVLSKPGMSLMGEIRALDRRTLLFLTLSGLATGLSWLCYFRALQLGPASRVAPLDKLSVPLVIVFAWLLLGEKLTAASIVGGLLITTGAVVIALG